MQGSLGRRARGLDGGPTLRIVLVAALACCAAGSASAAANRPRLSFPAAQQVSLDAARDRAQLDFDNGATNVSYKGLFCTRQSRLRIDCQMQINGTDPQYDCKTDTPGAAYERDWTQVVRKNKTTRQVSTWIIGDEITYTCPTAQG